MQQLLLVIHLIACISIVVLVLIQHGKGADAGAAFGSGASGTVFGSQGTGAFLLKVTTAIAIVFFATSVTLAYFAGHRPSTTQQVNSIMEDEETVAPRSSPADAFSEPVQDEGQADSKQKK